MNGIGPFTGPRGGTVRITENDVEMTIDQLWGCFKGGRVLSFGTSKKDILIGYDMMPLRGLDVTEREMVDEGYVFALANVERCDWGQEHGFAPMIHDGFNPHMLAWGCFKQARNDGMEYGGAWVCSFRSTVGYLHSRMKVLEHWHFGLDDCRRWPTYERALRETFEVFEEHGIEIVPVRAEPVVRRSRAAVLRQFERMVPGAFPAAPFPRD